LNYDAYITKKGRYCRVTGSDVNIRIAPDIRSTVLARADRGSILFYSSDGTATAPEETKTTVDGITWWKMYYYLHGEFHQGYISSRYLQEVTSGAELKYGAGPSTVFDFDETTNLYTSPFGCYDKLVYDSGTDEYVLKKNDMTRYGFKRINNDVDNTYRLAWITDKFDNIVEIIGSYNGSYKIDKIVEKLDETDDENNRCLQFNYSTEDNVNIVTVTDSEGRTVKYELSDNNLSRVKNIYGKYVDYEYMLERDDESSDKKNKNKLTKTKIYVDGVVEPQTILTNYYNKITGRRYKEMDAYDKVRYWICRDAAGDESSDSNALYGTTERQYYDENNNKTTIQYENYLKLPKTEIYADGSQVKYEHYYLLAGSWIPSTSINKENYTQLNNITGTRDYTTDRYGYTTMVEKDEHGNTKMITNKFILSRNSNGFPISTSDVLTSRYKYDYENDDTGSKIINNLTKEWRQKGRGTFEEGGTIEEDGYIEYKYDNTNKAKLIRVAKRISSGETIYQESSGLIKKYDVNHNEKKWSVQESPNFNGGSAISSSTYGDYIEFNFTGKKIKWVGFLGSNTGSALVTIDNGTPQIVDTYRSSDMYGQIAEFEFNDYGRHTIKIAVNNTQNKPIVIDYLLVTNNYALTDYSYYNDNLPVKGLVKSITNPDGGITEYTYYSNGYIQTVKDPVLKSLEAITNGVATQYTYDSVGRKTSETTPKGFVTRYIYNNNDMNQLNASTDDVDAIVIIDGNNSVNVRSTKSCSTTKIVYDGYGNKIQEISPNQYAKNVDGSGEGTTYQYDLKGRMKKSVIALTDEYGQVLSQYITENTYENAGMLQRQKKYELTNSNEHLNEEEYIYEYDNMYRLSKVYFDTPDLEKPVILEEYIYKTNQHLDGNSAPVLDVNGTPVLDDEKKHRVYYKDNTIYIDNTGTPKYIETTTTIDYLNNTETIKETGKAAVVKKYFDNGLLESIQTGNESNKTTYWYEAWAD
jgi:hypothetical protein